MLMSKKMSNVFSVTIRTRRQMHRLPIILIFKDVSGVTMMP